MVRQAGGRGKDSDPCERYTHANGFTPREEFEAKEDGQSERIDGGHTHDDGGVGNVGVAETEGEEELVNGDTEEAEVGEGPEIVKRDSRFVSCGREKRQACTERGEDDHEETGGDDAERAEGESRKMAKSNFDDEEIDGPNGHEERDRKCDRGAGGRASIGRSYKHRNWEWSNASIIRVWVR